MKALFILISLFVFTLSEACRNVEPKQAKNVNADTVSFIARFEKSKEQKDGFDLNGYILPLSTEQADTLDGKLIKVSGVVYIHEGHGPEYYDKKGIDIPQERQGITKYIASPVIEVVKENLKR